MAVIALETLPARINAEAVAILRDFLALAEKGELTGVAVAATLNTGSSQSQASSSDNFQALLGSVVILQHRMIDESRRAET